VPLTSGTRLGPYEVLAPLGAGGMGEVYRARDTRLGREVALKVLPHHLSSSTEIRARFEREARTVSSLNHAHICVLHDVGREGDTDYLVMELVEGESLAQRLARGPLPAPEVLRLGGQIADALDRAHRASVVHRDLKPGNVMLSKSGAKLMDFGLARAIGLAGSTGASTVTAMTQSPTVAQPLTAEGSIVGTFQYMSPEQLEGKEADPRSDLWALGCVLYEMATGARAFEGKTQASLISAIMRDQPRSMTEIAPLFPPALERLVKQCLAKDPDDRWQSAGDVRRELEWIATGDSLAARGPAPVRRRARWGPIVAWAAAALAAGAIGWMSAPSRAPARALVRSDLLPPNQEGMIGAFALSPAGDAIAFTFSDSVGTSRLWVRALDEPAARMLEHTENATFPFWSPDSRQLGFFANGKLRRIPVAGGPVQALADAPVGRGGSWGSRRVILFAPDARGPLMQIPETGGTPRVATTFDSVYASGSHRFPCFLPDGRHFVCLAVADGQPTRVVLAALDDPRGRWIAESDRAPVVGDGDRLVTVRDGVIFMQDLDVRSGMPRGEPVSLPETVEMSQRVTGGPVLTASRFGLLAYMPADRRFTDAVWVDAGGRTLASPINAERFAYPLLSPDGRRVIVDGGQDHYVMDLATGARVRVSPETGETMWVIWGPGENEITSNYDRSSAHHHTMGGLETVRLGANGEGILGHWLWRHQYFILSTGITRDGKYLVVNELTPGAQYDIGYVVAGDSTNIQPYLRRRASDVSGTPSPDGRWLVYASDVDGTPQLYLDSFPTPRRARRVSSAGVKFDPQPIIWWRADGRALYYVAPDSRTMMTCDIGAGSDPAIGTPRAAFHLPSEYLGCSMSADGRRCLAFVPRGTRVSTLRLVENWTLTASR
jgi:eukaryotic-like serine/threonine-protein kinase